MPTRSKRPCTYPGCTILVSEGWRCPRHPASARERTNEAQRRYDRPWRKFSKAYLSEPENQFCRIRTNCQGDFATEVDHIVPLRLAPQRKYDRTNLQPACHRCHSAKTLRGA